MNLVYLNKRPAYRGINEWMRDKQTIRKAYKKMRDDMQLDAEIRRLEYEYFKKYLIDDAGEDEADRILYEHGFEPLK